MILRFPLHPFVSQRLVRRQSLAVLLHQQLLDEIDALLRHVVEGFIVEVIFADRHVAHRLNVALARERRQPRHAVKRSVKETQKACFD